MSRPWQRIGLSVAATLVWAGAIQSAEPRRARRVAIMPFENLTGQQGRNWVGQGIAETLGTDLQKVKTLRLVDRAQVKRLIKELDFQASGFADPKTAKRVGRMLGAEVLVVGAYQQMEDLLRITARFVEVETATVTEAAKVTGPARKLFDLQDELALGIARNLGALVSGGEQQALQRKPTASLVAYQLYVEAIQHIQVDALVRMHLTAMEQQLTRVTDNGNLQLDNAQVERDRAARYLPALIEAEGRLAKAIAIDPDYAAAHSALSLCCMFQIAVGQSPGDKARQAALIKRAAAAMKKASTLDPDLTDTPSLAIKAMMDPGGSLAGLTKVIARHPDRPDLYLWRGFLRMNANRPGWDEDMRQVLRLDPPNRAAHFFLVKYHSDAKRYDRALAVCDRSLRYGKHRLTQYMKALILEVAKPPRWKQRLREVLIDMKRSGGPYAGVATRWLQRLDRR